MESYLVHHQGAIKAVIAHGKKRIYHNTKIKVPANAIDSKGLVKATVIEYAAKLNEKILQRKKELDEAILTDLKRNGEVDLDRVKEILYGTGEAIQQQPTIDKTQSTLYEMINHFTSNQVKMNRGLKWRYSVLLNLSTEITQRCQDLLPIHLLRLFEKFTEGMNANTAGTRYKNFKKFYMWCKEEGYPLPKMDWRTIMPKTFKPDFIFLTEERIQQLHDHKPSTDHLKNVKDIFLVLIYTGMRYSDYFSLTKNDLVVEKGNQMFIEKVTQKTKSRFKVPITNPDVIEIVHRMPKMANAVFNRSVKELGKELLWEEMVRFQVDTSKFDIEHFYNLLSSSVGRHTAATRWLLKKKAHNEIMSWTGWTDIHMIYYYADKLRISTYDSMKEMDAVKEEIEKVEVEAV